MITYDHIPATRPSARRSAPAGAPSQRTALLPGVVVWAVVVVLTRSFAPAGLALVPATAAAAHDIRARVVPDRWAVTTASVALVGTVIAAGRDGAVAAIVGAAAAGLPHLVVHLVWPTRLGFGDVKLAAALGAMVGPSGSVLHEQLLLAMLLVSGAAAVAIVVAVASRRPDVAHAPVLVIAAIGVVLVAERFGVVPA